MTQSNYTRNILNIKDVNVNFVNVNFYENCLKNRIINSIETKIFKTYLTYIPTHCPLCGNNNNDFNGVIKCIKKIAFGYRSLYHFKTRIMLIHFIYKYN